MNSIYRQALILATLLSGHGASAAEAQGESLAALAMRIDQPRLGGEIVDPGPISIGRGVIRPASPVRVLLAADEPCGLVVTGAGTFTYRVDDRFSVPVARRNFKTASSFKATETAGGLDVSTAIDGAVIWGWELPTGLQVRPSGSPTQILDWVAPLLHRTASHQPHQELIVARRLRGAGMIHAMIGGKGFALELDVDPLVERQESLRLLERVTKADSRLNVGRYYPVELATQPIGRQWWEHEVAPLVAVHHSLLVDNDKGSHVTVSSTTHLEGSGAPANLWRASLANRRTAKDKKVYPLVVQSVTVDEKPADFLFEGGVLMVALEPPIGKGRIAKVSVVQEGDYAIRYGGHKYWTLGSWPWYPSPPPNGRLATVDIEVRAPADLEIFASGKTLSRETRDGFTVLESRLEKPMEYVVVSAGKYHVFRESRMNIDASVATYFGKDERGARRLLNNFFAAADCYRRYLDIPYPFAEVEIIELASWGFGQAPPGVIFITQEAVSSFLEGEDRYFSEGVNGRYFHEIAHAWWPHIAKRDAWEENWTSESFAEYISAVCLDTLADGNSRFQMKASLAEWRGRAKEIGDGGSIYLADHLAGNNRKDRVARHGLLYAKGPLVLHALRQELRKQAGDQTGERQFWLALRSYLKSFSYTWGGTPYLVAILDQITGRSWQPWFERYVYGTEMPPYKK